MQSAQKLREMLERDIDRFDVESTKHKLIHRRAQAAIIGLTAATAIVAGAGLIVPNVDKAIQFAVLCLAATTTAITSWVEMRRARELWQHEREVFYALKDILRELDFYEAEGNLSAGEVEAYFQKASSILGSSTHKWSRIQEKKLEEPKDT